MCAFLPPGGRASACERDPNRCPKKVKQRLSQPAAASSSSSSPVRHPPPPGPLRPPPPRQRPGGGDGGQQAAEAPRGQPSARGVHPRPLHPPPATSSSWSGHSLSRAGGSACRAPSASPPSPRGAAAAVCTGAPSSALTAEAAAPAMAGLPRALWTILADGARPWEWAAPRGPAPARGKMLGQKRERRGRDATTRQRRMPTLAPSSERRRERRRARERSARRPGRGVGQGGERMWAAREDWSSAGGAPLHPHAAARLRGDGCSAIGRRGEGDSARNKATGRDRTATRPRFTRRSGSQLLPTNKTRRRSAQGCPPTGR